MLRISDRLTQAYLMKNEFHKFMGCQTRDEARKQLGMRNVFGVRNFERFINRILHAMS